MLFDEPGTASVWSFLWACTCIAAGIAACWWINRSDERDHERHRQARSGGPSPSA